MMGTVKGHHLAAASRIILTLRPFRSSSLAQPFSRLAQQGDEGLQAIRARRLAQLRMYLGGAGGDGVEV